MGRRGGEERGRGRRGGGRERRGGEGGGGANEEGEGRREEEGEGGRGRGGREGEGRGRGEGGGGGERRFIDGDENARRFSAVLGSLPGTFEPLAYVRSNDRFQRQQRTRYAHIDFFGS